LYGFAQNSPVHYYDFLGKAIRPCSEFDKTQVVGDATYGRTEQQNNKKIETNGCGSAGSGWVPDSFGDASFTPACNEHDRCYSTCGADKDDCDEALKNDMSKECERAYPGFWNLSARLQCKAVAHAYEIALELAGGGPFEEAQDAHCFWECCEDGK
jgi:hypothetical protein